MMLIPQSSMQGAWSWWRGAPCCLPGREPRVVLPDWERRPRVSPNHGPL